MEVPPFDERGSAVRTRPLALLSAAAVLSAVLLAGCTPSAEESEPSRRLDRVRSATCARRWWRRGPHPSRSRSRVSVGTESTATFDGAAGGHRAADDAWSKRDRATRRSRATTCSSALSALRRDDGREGRRAGLQTSDLAPAADLARSRPRSARRLREAGLARSSRSFRGSAEQAAPPQVYIIDVLDVIAADDCVCRDQDPGEAFPTVEFDDAGVPTDHHPGRGSARGVQLEVSQGGRRRRSSSRATASLVEYTGVKWSDGTSSTRAGERRAGHASPRPVWCRASSGRSKARRSARRSSSPCRPHAATARARSTTHRPHRPDPGVRRRDPRGASLAAASAAGRARHRHGRLARAPLAPRLRNRARARLTTCVAS